MLYVFSGDRLLARKQCQELINACREKRKEAEYIRITSHTEQNLSLEELLYSQGLFEKKYIIFCDEVLENSEITKHLLDKPELYVTSENMFIVFESVLSESHKKLFEKVGVKLYHHKEKTNTQEDTKSLFNFVDTFMRLDKQKSLIALHRLLRSNVDPQSIINILLWQIRTLALVSTSQNQKETKLKPFVYNKVKKFLIKHQNPVNRLFFMERTIRNGRTSGTSEEEIAENIVLFY